MSRGIAVLVALIAVCAMAAPAAATPVATDEASYTFLGRVFPDPQGGCSSGPCSPQAQGRFPATQFIGVDEYEQALQFMNTRERWNRYMEVWPLDGKQGNASGSGLGEDAFPGNNMGRLEFDPKAEYRSAGLPQSDTSRRKSDLLVVRVTDESVPDAGKKRYALSLSIHGIERAGAEGGIRTMEDLVTAATTQIGGQPRSNLPILPDHVEPNAPTYAQVLRETIIYFTVPNPDGWRRGTVSNGGVFFQRYNGNGVDLNRDWPDVGFTFRPYSGLSEPESQAFNRFYQDVMAKTDSRFAAGDDLHGMPEADALSYTLLPHGLHQYDKDLRLRESAKTINRATYDSVKWSPIVQSNDAPQGGGPPCVPGALGDVCAKIYGQTWGTVYDTINYTTTGTLGDWFDSRIGLNADGIDNEMAFSHLDKNIVFDPHTEQMHVDGNRALIFARLAEILSPPDGEFDAPGRKGYVPNERLQSPQKDYQPGAPAGTRASDPHSDNTPTPVGSAFEFRPIPVERSEQIYNGGMRVDITAGNVGGIGTGGGEAGLLGGGTLQVQCRYCDDHPAPPGTEDTDWITVAEDYNQSPVYAQSGLTAAVNNPDAGNGKGGRPIEWRALVNADAAPARMDVTYTSGPASADGNTEGGNPPFQRAYDVANTDFFRDLDKHVQDRRDDFDTIDPRAVIEGRQSLNSFESIALADNPLPGYTGQFKGETALVGPTPDFDFAHDPAKNTNPGGYQGTGPRVPNSFETKEFTIAPEHGNRKITVRIDWASEDNDFDMYLYRRTASGGMSEVARSAAGGTKHEEINVERPPAGTYIIYVDNWASDDDNWTGKTTFEALPTEASGSFTKAQKDAYVAKLRDWVRDGGNLILTDGALRLLTEFADLPGSAVSQQLVYVGQTTFSTGSGNTLEDRLALNVNQPGSRFNSGMRRQMFEPTPLGFAIQDDESGNDESHSRQWQVARAPFEAAGGRVAGTSVDSGDRDAAPVHDQVTLGELKLGKGQVRIAGALLPQPTEEYDHQYGIEPYAVTYTGYIVTRNLFDTTRRGLPSTGRNFVISRRAVKLRKQRARVRVSCRIPGGGCKGRLKLRVRKMVTTKKGKRKRKLVRIGAKKFNIPQNKRRNRIIKVKLKRKQAAYVSRRPRRVRVRALANVRFGDGTRGQARRRFWLYRPSPGPLPRRRR